MARTSFACSSLGVMLSTVAVAQVQCDTMLTYPIGSVSDVLAVGDMNADGVDDVVIATGFSFESADSYKLFIHHGSETGPVLASVIPYPDLYPGVQTMAVGDVDDDGLQDIVIGYQDKIGILYQQTDHNFSAVQVHESGQSVNGVAIGDVTGDGLSDIVVCHWNQTVIKVFERTPGGFQTRVYPKPQGGYDEIAIGDVNGDGRADVVLMTGQLQDSGLHIYLQGSNGLLGSYVSYQSPTPGTDGWLSGFAIGDINGDGANDLVASQGGNMPNARIVLWTQDPVTHTFNAPVLVDAYQVPGPVEIADLDCDGRSEIVVAHSGWSAYSIYTSDGQGQLGAYDLYQVFSAGPYHPNSLALADLDGDGRKDVLLANWQFGLGWARNTSLPQHWGEFAEYVVVDTTGTLVTVTTEHLFEQVLDTTDWLITSSYIMTTITEHASMDTIRTDSVLVRNGTICGGAVVDTVHAWSFSYTDPVITRDTQVVVLSVDTMNTSVEEVGKEHWSLVPNPTMGPVELRSNGGPRSTLTLAVHDQHGRCVLTRSMVDRSVQLDLFGRAPGVYVLSVQDEMGMPVFRSRVVLTR